MCHEPKTTIAVHTYEKPYSVVLLISPPLRISLRGKNSRYGKRQAEDVMIKVNGAICVTCGEYYHRGHVGVVTEKTFQCSTVGHIASQQVACYPSSTPTLDYCVF